MLRKFIYFDNFSSRKYCQQLTKLMGQQFNEISNTEPSTQHLLSSLHIENAIKLSPILSSIPHEIWCNSHEMFLSHGIETEYFLKIISNYPTLLSRPTKRLSDSIEIWRNCQFGEKRFHQLIINYPQLLEIQNEHELLTKVTLLKEFVQSSKNVWRILMSYPNILQESKCDIEEKFNYLTNIMKIETPEIVKSNVFRQDLFEIQCRHTFLERLGIYKAKPKKKNDIIEQSKNPRLHKIVDTNDKEFSAKVCGVSQMEFESFRELYKKEMDIKLQESEKDSEIFDSNDNEN